MRYVLCDDHRLFVEPFAAALGGRGHDVRVVTRPQAVPQAVERHRADACVVDLCFPHGSGLDAVMAVRLSRPDCPVVVLTGSSRPRDEARAEAAGAAAYLRKDQPLMDIFAALERTVSGRRTAPMPASQRRPPLGGAAHVRGLVGQLTVREREVLRRLVLAEDTELIASSLRIAPSTARTHLQNVLIKLRVHTRLEAVALVAGAGLDAELLSA